MMKCSSQLLLTPINFSVDVHFHWNEDNELHKYIVSLYWAVTTISSVG